MALCSVSLYGNFNRGVASSDLCKNGFLSHQTFFGTDLPCQFQSKQQKKQTVYPIRNIIKFKSNLGKLRKEMVNLKGKMISTTIRSADSMIPSASNRYPPKYDVFLSFRGEDVRGNFLEYLYRALRQKEILTFKDDDKLKDGEDIKGGLYESIEDSAFSIVILSVNYASSSWCLDELVRILHCKRTAGHVVYPVFYHVTPSEVRKREGEFGKGFAKAAAANEGKVEKWTETLDEVANLKGWAYPHTRFENEPTLIDNLVDKIFMHLKEVNRLVERIPGLVVEKFSVEKVEHLPGPVIVDQPTASKNLMKVLDLVNGDRVNIIGVWGMGGVGKTTLVKNLNNMLETSNSGKQFSIIMWATASKDADIRSIQSQLVERLNLEVKYGENMERTAGRLHQRLKQEKRFLFILDDVREHIDLNYLGLSGLVDKGNKIILTTRSLDVCQKMETDDEVRVDVLNEDESWQLFIQKAGPVASLEDIEPIAKEVNLECSGLPLAIIAVGASMRGKKKTAVWENALNAFRKSEPLDEGIEKVYRRLKWSYDSIYFQNMNIKSCFLYCCLYPEDWSIPVNDLVVSWIGEGLVKDDDSYEDMVNTGISMVEYLKASCLLEDGMRNDTVKMHDVVRDVATWIASSLEDDCKSYVCSGSATSRFSEEVFQGNYKRVSLMGTLIRRLPNCSKQYPQVLSLLLQGKFLPEIPKGFILGLPGLRVLNLSKLPTNYRQITDKLVQSFISDKLPSELRALLLHSSHFHELPPVGDLRMLQVFDCSYSSLRTFPEGMEKLTNLRSLRLLYTQLDLIKKGVISKLTRLEILDMTGSSYKWNADGERRTPFDELRYLNQLTFLSISFVMSDYSTTDFSWLTRVKRFNLVVNPSLGAYIAQDQYEKTISIFNAELRGVGFRYLIQTASCVVLENCEQVERLWVDLDKRYCYKGLKSLHISNCGWTFQPVSDVPSEIDILPNLEELILYNVSSVESISQLMHCFGSRFLKLRIIRVSECYNFSSLFGEQDMWQKLETLEVMGCHRIKKLPFNSLSSIKEIRGEQIWWNQLEWDDQDSKLILQHCFKPVDEDVELMMFRRSLKIINRGDRT